MDKDLNGLILIGGKSVRMGVNKSIIRYHEKPQVMHLLKLLENVISETYLSVRKGQSVEFTVQLIEDAFEVKGPLNGLLSAHKASPTKAWMVLAVDLPFVSKSTIERLINERDKSMFATTLINTELPEPLAAIWEPHALAVLTKHILKGDEIYPRKFLIDNPVKSIKAEGEELFNVNTKTDFEKAKSMIEQKK